MQQESFEFDLILREIPCILGGLPYVLREASGAAAATHRNALSKSITIVDGKPSGILDGFADTDPLLVSLCLFNQHNQPVPLSVVRSWPDRVVKALAKKAKEISGIDQGGDDSKNLPSAGGGGSKSPSVLASLSSSASPGSASEST